MRKLVLSLLFLLHNINLQAQLLKAWDHRYGGSMVETIQCLLPLPNGNLIVAGYSSSGISGDKSAASYGKFDYWIVCTSGGGTKLWDATYGGNNTDHLATAISTADGGLLLGGYSYSDISGIKTQASQGSSDYWIVKTDSAGNYQWDKRYGGSSYDALTSLCQTSDGGYILGGRSESGISGDKSQSSWGGNDYWVVKIDSIGTKIWDKRFGGTGNDYCNSVIQTPDGGYVLGGMSDSGINGDKTESNWGGVDFWSLKIDSSGTKIWDKRFGTTEDDECYSACSDGSDGIVLGGSTDGGVSGDKTESNWGGIDFWAVHVDGAGNKVWDRRFGGTANEDEYENIYRTNDGGYILCGTSYSNISGNKTQSNLGTEQTWMVKCDSDGNYVIDRTLLTYEHEETGFAIQLDNGCFIVANNTDASAGGDKTESSQGESDYFIAEYCEGPPEANFSVADTSICQGQCITFTDASFLAQTWSWSFPGGTPSSSALQNPNVCYYNAGAFDVQLIVTNISGTDTIFLSSIITVLPLTIPTIIQNGNVLTCNIAAISYQWYFNYNSIPGATNQSYTAAQAGLYSVMVTNSYGCSAISAAFNFTPQIPAPMFMAQDTAICEKFCTNFIDQSTNNPIAWNWIFEAGAPPTSSDQNPDVCYYLPGIFDVTLITYDGIEYDTLLLPNYMTIFTTPALPTITINGNMLTASSAYSYQWQFNNVSIPGATNQTYLATQSGGYTLITTSADGCSSQVSIDFTLVGVPAIFSEEEISIHPNPGNGIFTLNLPEGFQKATLIVYDVLGKEIFRQSLSDFKKEDHIILDLQSTSDGMYFIRLSEDARFVVAKIIKQETD